MWTAPAGDERERQRRHDDRADAERDRERRVGNPIRQGQTEENPTTASTFANASTRIAAPNRAQKSHWLRHWSMYARSSRRSG